MKNEQDIEYEKSICYNEGHRDGLAEGRDEGRRDNAISTARNLLKEGITAEVVARCIGLTLEEVLSLNKE
ncbi:MAG: hypothetical protein ACI399_05100 [Candidatus Cryptobacteroides sp.]